MPRRPPSGWLRALFEAADPEPIIELLYGSEFTSGSTVLTVLIAAFIPICIGNVAGNMVVAMDLQRRYLERECVSAFNDAARAATGHLLAVRFCSPEEGRHNQNNRD